MSENYYELLGVAKDADEPTIKKAYRKLALQHHPDKGGSPEMFNKIGAAYEVLSNAEKRKLYDLGGMDAVERGHAGGEEGMDIFDLFGGGGRRRQQRGPSGPKKGDPVNFPLPLTLEEMYTGVVKKLRLTRSVACAGCEGKGGKSVSSCGTCQGRGVRVVVQRLGPGMISQSQTTCNVCQGEGKVIAAGSECKDCSGQKIIKEKKQLDVTVPPGARGDQTAVFVSEGDQLPGQLAGDIIVEFSEKPHDRFTRRGHHLYFRQKISLLEALTGFTMYIQHLDGHEVKVSSNQVLKPGDVLCIPEEGFPHSFGNGRGIETGSLYINFDIEFPTTQQIMGKGDQAKKSLTAALPQNSSVQKQPVTKNVVETSPRVVDMATEERRHVAEERQWERHQNEQSRARQSQGGSFDDDEEHHHGGMGQPACQQL